jgi:hypothetical protein
VAKVTAHPGERATVLERREFDPHRRMPAGLDTMSSQIPLIAGLLSPNRDDEPSGTVVPAGVARYVQEGAYSAFVQLLGEKVGRISL